MRKTVDIKALIEKANHMLAASEDSLVKEREGIFTFVESILHDAGCYNGFNSLTKEQIKGRATTYGIDYTVPHAERMKSIKENQIDPWFDGRDLSRKFFYLHNKLYHKKVK